MDHEQLVGVITQVLRERGLTPGATGETCSPGQTCQGRGDCCGSCRANETGAQLQQALGSLEHTRLCTELGACDIEDTFAGIIDHTLLKASATYDDIDQLCAEAVSCGFKSVCVNPVHVARCARNLRGHKPLVCTVIGFPLGASHTRTKAFEARQALRDGARELDMVIDIGALRSGDLDRVEADIRALVHVAHDERALLKVIIETALLTDEQKVQACVAAKQAGADFVKTSTGFSTAGATTEDIALMAKAVDFKLQVKASGGVRSRDDLLGMVRAGATRIGASVGVKIAGCQVSGGSVASGSY